MRVISLLIGAFIVLGCQGNKDVSSSAAPSEAADAPAPAPKAAGEPVETAKPEPSAEVPSESDILVSKVMGLMQMRTVEATDDGIKITFPLEVSKAIDEKSSPQAVSDAMMFAAFYTAPLLYGRTDDVDGLEQRFTHIGKTVGTIKTTRASFQSLGYDEAMSGVTDEKAKREAYRKLLAKLPRGAVKIKRKYRP